MIPRRLAFGAVCVLMALCAQADTGILDVPGGRIAWERSGRGAPLVLVHDGLLPGASWDEVWPDLARRFDVLRYDRRGYGASTTATADFDNVADLLALLDAQRLDRVALVGASAGGGLAVNFTLEHPERVSRLVLEGPVLPGFSYSGHYMERGIRNTGTAARPGDAEAALGKWSLDAYLTDARNADGRARLRALIERFPLAAQGRLKGSQRPDPDARSRLAGLKLPVRLLVGESDIPDVQAHVGALELGVTGAERLVVSHAGHLIHLERPDTFVRLVAEFVDPDGTAKRLLADGLGSPATPATRALFAYDARMPLDVREKGVERRGRALVHDVHFASPHGDRAPAYVVEPAAPGARRSRAGLVFLHHGQGDRGTFVDEAVALAERGVVSVLLEAPENRPEAAPVAVFDSAVDEDEIRHTVVDLRRCFDVLVGRRDVDPARLAYVGWSLGATMGGRLAGLEPRARGFVMLAGWASLTDAAANGHGRFAASFAAYLDEAARTRWLERIHPLDGTHLMDGTAPMLLQFATRDPFIARFDAALYRAAAGARAESRDYEIGHFGLDRTDARRDREEWLARLLSLPPR